MRGRAGEIENKGLYQGWSFDISICAKEDNLDTGIISDSSSTTCSNDSNNDDEDDWTMAVEMLLTDTSCWRSSSSQGENQRNKNSNTDNCRTVALLRSMKLQARHPLQRNCSSSSSSSSKRLLLLLLLLLPLWHK